MQHDEVGPRWRITPKSTKQSARRLVSRTCDVEMIIYDDNSKALKRALFATMTIIARPSLGEDGWRSCFVPTQPWTTIAVLTSEPGAKAVKRPSARRMSPSPSPIVVSASRKPRVFRWKPSFRWRNKRSR